MKLWWILPVFLVVGCTVSPLGREQLLLYSPQQMNNMGQQQFSAMKQQLAKKGLIDRNRRTNAYVRCVADALLRSLGENPRAWEVVVFNNKAANAFAMPGRKIGVYNGLLKVARNQDQLATVLAHEIGHVQANHANERISRNMLMQGGLAAVDALAGPSRQTLQMLGMGAQYGIMLPYNRSQESEADLIGLQLMAGAGFDPGQSIVLWQNMHRANPGGPPEFLSTHPSDRTRMADLASRMEYSRLRYQRAVRAGKRPRCRR